jgi:hypothetical protein
MPIDTISVCCPKCHAGPWAKCKDYRGKGKATCADRVRYAQQIDRQLTAAGMADEPDPEPIEPEDIGQANGQQFPDEVPSDGKTQQVIPGCGCSYGTHQQRDLFGPSDPRPAAPRPDLPGQQYLTYEEQAEGMDPRHEDPGPTQQLY